MTDPHGTGEPLDVFLPLREAADTYGASTEVLRARARSGALRAYKVAGPNGREWRVSARSLEAAGFRPKVPAPTPVDERVRELEARLAAVRRLLGAEQRRADRADQELGHALLEIGRLRSSVTSVSRS